MKRISVAFVVLVLILGAIFYRNRVASHPQPVLPTTGGVVLLTVSNCDVRELTDIATLPHFAALAKQNPIGLLPTRNGTADESDRSAAERMLLAGSRTPKPDSPTLPEVIPGDWISTPAVAGQVITVASKAKAGSVLFVPCDLSESEARRKFDTLIAKLTDSPGGLPNDWSLLVVGVTPTPEAITRRERVAPVLLWQHGIRYSKPPLLTSPSVRNRPGLAASTDMAATVAALLGLQKERQHIGDGRAIEMVTFPEDRVTYLIHQTIAWGMQAREQKLLPGLPWVIAILLLGSVLLPWETSRRIARNVALVIPISIIVVAFLFPVSSAMPAWGIYLAAGLATIGIAFLVRRDEIPVWIALITMIVLVGDTICGGPMLSRTPLSYSVLEAARYYGIGNEVSGLLLGAAVVAIGRYLFAPTFAARIAVSICGFALAILSGAPMLGADAGGFVATLVAMATLALAPETNRPINRKVVGISLLVGCVILAGVIAFALWDAGRGEAERTHIGEAVAALQGHGISAITTIIQRKVAVNIRLLVTSPWAVLFATEIVLLLWNVLKKRQARQPEIVSPEISFPISVALLFASLSLFVLNDSGTVAAATCGIWFFAIRSGNQPLPEYHQ